MINNVKPGDYVFAAFGINDSGTAHGPVSPSDFQKQMGVMAAEVAAKKATFIPTTSSPLQAWSGGKETNDRLQPYCDATLALGASKGLLVDDLNARAIEYYDMIGQTAGPPSPSTATRHTSTRPARPRWPSWRRRSWRASRARLRRI